MRNFWKLVILFLVLSMHVAAQKVAVKSDTNAILIGEQVKLDLNYELPINQVALFPVFKDTITS